MEPEELKMLSGFDSRIRPYIEFLLKANVGKFSLLNEPLRIIGAYSGCTANRNEGNFDSFKLLLPYAQQTLSWEVFFDLANPKEPPDFIFDAADNEFYPPLERVNSLVCWDWQNRESLVAVVTELLEHYRDYQLLRAEENITVQRHMRSILAENPKQMQVVINKKERGLGMVNVLLKFEPNFSNLPAYLAQGNLGDDWAVLYVCFPHPESSSIQTQLYLSPAVENAFGGCASLKIPVFQTGILLGEYYSCVFQLLQKQVKLIKESYESRKDLIAAFLSQFGKSLLQYDAIGFRKIVLLLAWNDFFFTFTVELPLYFPTEQPVFVFKSVYHTQRGKPYVERHTTFPYSPRWSGNEMVKRFSSYILENIKEFQLSSVKNPD